METFESEILVVGAGGAGMSAAVKAAENGAQVALVDENPDPGGQIWRKGIGDKRVQGASVLIGSLDQSNVKLFPQTTVYDASSAGSLSALRNGRRLELKFEKLIIASGARERFIPFPGWTLPNVFGVGGLQALVKGGFPVAGKRIIVAGTGPLLLAVADYLKQKEADVLFVAEQARYSSLASFGISLARFPGKLAQAAALRLKPGAVKLHADTYVTRAEGSSRVESVWINQAGGIKEFGCDLLAVGYHLLPNLELPSLLGLDSDQTGVTVNEFQRSSNADIFAAGETTGIGGIELACIEGEIAGYAASGNNSAAQDLFERKKRLQRFAERLNKTFELRDELSYLADESTIVCRCEDVTLACLEDFVSWREAKLQSRCGMGPCQGRICGPATEHLFGWKIETARPPLVPVKLKSIGEDDQ